MKQQLILVIAITLAALNSFAAQWNYECKGTSPNVRNETLQLNLSDDQVRLTDKQGLDLNGSRDKAYVPRSRNRQECGLTVGVARVGIRTGVEQHLQYFGVAVFGGEAHRRGAVVVGERYIGAGMQETLDLVDVARIHRPLQRRAAIGVPMVDIFGPP